jgi:hemoglobin
LPSLYEHAGGEEALHSLEGLFNESVLSFPLLQPLFGAGQPENELRNGVDEPS